LHQQFVQLQQWRNISNVQDNTDYNLGLEMWDKLFNKNQ